MTDATNPAVVQDAQQYAWRKAIRGFVYDDWSAFSPVKVQRHQAGERLVAYIERLEAERDALLAERTLVDIVFDGPPSHESGRFVEVEDMSGAGVRVGEWIDRGNGYWALRIPTTTLRG